MLPRVAGVVPGYEAATGWSFENDQALEGEISTMTAVDSVPFAAMLEENLASASPDMLRAMVALFAGQLMGAEADAACGAEWRPDGDQEMFPTRPSMLTVQHLSAWSAWLRRRAGPAFGGAGPGCVTLIVRRLIVAASRGRSTSFVLAALRGLSNLRYRVAIAHAADRGGDTAESRLWGGA
jgi:hypothetical protein